MSSNWVEKMCPDLSAYEQRCQVFPGTYAIGMLTANSVLAFQIALIQSNTYI